MAVLQAGAEGAEGAGGSWGHPPTVAAASPRDHHAAITDPSESTFDSHGKAIWIQLAVLAVALQALQALLLQAALRRGPDVDKQAILRRSSSLFVRQPKLNASSAVCGGVECSAPWWVGF